MAVIAPRQKDAGSTVTAAHIQYPNGVPNINQTGTVFEEIELRLVRHFVPTKEQAVVYVITPEGAVDPCKRVVMFANCGGSRHAQKAVFMGSMLFTYEKLRPRRVPVAENGSQTFWLSSVSSGVTCETVVATFDGGNPGSRRSRCHEAVLSEQDGHEHSESQREKPQGRRWRPYRADPEQFAGCSSRIQNEPAGIEPFKQKEDQRYRCAVNEMSYERRQER